MGFTKCLSNAWNTFKPVLKEGHVAQSLAVSGEGVIAKGNAIMRGMGAENLHTIFSGDAVAGVRNAYAAAREGGKGLLGSAWAGLGELNTKSFQKGYGSRMAWGAGMGAAAGGGRSS